MTSYMSGSSQLAERLAYYGKGLLRQLLPYSVAASRRNALLRRAAHHPDLSEIDERVQYYNKRVDGFDASDAPMVCEVDRSRSRYFLDLDAFSRGFGPSRRLHYLFGDVTAVPNAPTIVKSRPIGPDNGNSILLKLDKLRHFRWTPDPVPFRDKKDSAVWRGTPLSPQRAQFVRTFYAHPTFDIGHSSRLVDDLPPKRSLTHSEQK